MLTGVLSHDAPRPWQIVPAENSIGEHASVVFFDRELIAESLLSRTPPATPVERRQRRGSKRDERALAIPPCGGSPTVRMREECVALRRAAVVAMVQATEVRNLHDVAVVT